jgi:NADPH:quinone reductase
VVYDSVGKTTLLQSFDCIRPRGMAVNFGQSSGAVPPFDPLLLSQKGCLFFTRPALPVYIAERAELEWRASDVFRWIGEGKLKLRIAKTYPLAEAAQAHRDLEGRGTTGKLMLAI